MDCHIRQYRNADHDSVWKLNDLALSALGPRPQGASIFDQELHDIGESYLQEGEFLVGLTSDILVAMVALKRLNHRTAEVTKMRVHPDHWRRGYGQAMLNRLEARASELSIDELWLDTSPKQIAAQHLYRKNGYHKFGRFPLGEFTLILFRKRLQAPEAGA